MVWLLWCAAVTRAVLPLATTVGGGGGVVIILTLGWLLARRLGDPMACFRAYHVDADEIIQMGPGRAVHRLAWAETDAYGATQTGMRLSGRGRSMVLPTTRRTLAALARLVMCSVVPRRAEALWAEHVRGGVTLMPPSEPGERALAWWAWGPAAAVAVVLGSPSGVLLGIGLATLERAAREFQRRWKSVVLQPSGVVLPGSEGRCFVGWDEVRADMTGEGLRVRGERDGGIVAPTTPDFMAVAAVIQLRTACGLAGDSDVRFRLQRDADGLAIVGEFDAA